MGLALRSPFTLSYLLFGHRILGVLSTHTPLPPTMLPLVCFSIPVATTL